MHGLKLVNGRTSKSFTDEQAIKRILKGLKVDEDMYISSKLKSVTSIEKIFKQYSCLEVLQDLIIYNFQDDLIEHLKKKYIKGKE